MSVSISNETNPLDDILSLPGVARLLGASESLVGTWIRGGHLKAYRLPVFQGRKGSRWKIRRRDLLAFMEQHNIPIYADHMGMPDGDEPPASVSPLKPTPVPLPGLTDEQNEALDAACREADITYADLIGKKKRMDLWLKRARVYEYLADHGWRQCEIAQACARTQQSIYVVLKKQERNDDEGRSEADHRSDVADTRQREAE